MKNLILRSISGVVFIALMVLGLTTSPIAFFALQCLVIMLCLREYYAVIWGYAHVTQQVLGVMTALIITAIFTGYVSYLFVSFAVIVMLIVQLYQSEKNHFNIVAQNVLGIAYIALPTAMWILFVRKSPSYYDGYFLLSCFIILWSSDVGAYIFGRLFGRNGKHKFFPKISPNKTWEGFIGGLITALITCVIIRKGTYMIPVSLIHSLVLTVIIVVFGAWGDLVESQFKRWLNIKDTGKIMPGHGGILDRFDASFLAIPAALFYLKSFSLL